MFVDHLATWLMESQPSRTLEGVYSGLTPAQSHLGGCVLGAHPRRLEDLSSARPDNRDADLHMMDGCIYEEWCPKVIHT